MSAAIVLALILASNLDRPFSLVEYARRNAAMTLRPEADVVAVLGPGAERVVKYLGPGVPREKRLCYFDPIHRVWVDLIIEGEGVESDDLVGIELSSIRRCATRVRLEGPTPDPELWGIRLGDPLPAVLGRLGEPLRESTIIMGRRHARLLEFWVGGVDDGLLLEVSERKGRVVAVGIRTTE